MWAGDKVAEARVKSLITSSILMVEKKGIDPISVENFVRLLFTSNEDWVVPTNIDDRRFVVFDVASHSAKNFEYFAEIDREMANGGREALLADLLAYDLDTPGAPNPRVNLKTAGLLEQKLRSFDPITSWWHDRLNDGAPTRRGEYWKTTIMADALYDDFLHTAEKIGLRRKAEQIAFGIKMRTLVPGIARAKRIFLVDDENGNKVNRRRWGYSLPSLKVCRDAFDELLGQPTEWPAVEEDGSGEEC